MTFWLWLYLISRMTICIAAGEIAIRYGAWSYLLAKAEKGLAASPLVFGMAILALSRTIIEGRWLSILTSPAKAASFTAIDGNDPISALGRAGVIIALCFMTYPVTKIVYRNSRERALVEVVVRIFLFLAGIVCGWIAALVYWLHV